MNKVKLSDFIFQYLVEKYGISHCFMVTGGGAMHLNDSIGHTPGLTYICNHHEQASAIAAEGYFRTSGKLCIVNVTTGPGGTNTITGVLGQWTDSIPAIYISGQIKTETMMGSYPNIPLRQLGDQEADIVSIVKPITKYAKTILEPCSIKYELDKAVSIALSGRPGPVWLDIPLDIQNSYIDPNVLPCYEENLDFKNVSFDLIEKQIELLLQKLLEAKSPVLYIGNGIRLANRVDEFIKLAEKLKIPIVTSISGSDIIWSDHPLYFGRPGICGDRLGNIMVQNSDLLIIIGTRLGIRQIGYAYDLFAPKAYKIMVDIDEAEMNKPTLNIDLPINCKIESFIDMLSKRITSMEIPSFEPWIEWGRKTLQKLPTLFQDNPSTSNYCNSYVFARSLFNQLNEGDVVVTGNGTAYTSTYQAMLIKKGVRVFANQGCAAMGYDIPAAIGAGIANINGKTILITGDGSFQMNIQELQTIVTYHLPIKIFVLENDGYLAIKTTQKNFFDGHYTGSNSNSGVICPSFSKIASAYGIHYCKCREEGIGLINTIKEILETDGPVICEINMDPEQTLFPKSASFINPETGKMSSAPLEKMAPFMDEELQKECEYFSDITI